MRATIRKSLRHSAMLWIGLLPVQTVASEALQAWPDPLLVTEWLSRESALARKFWRETSTEARMLSALQPQRDGEAARDLARSDDRSRARPQAKSRAVELASIYGVGPHLAAEVRIGGVLHRLKPQPGRDFASDQRGDDSIIAEQFSLGCLRLKYRKTQRRLCLSETNASLATDPDNPKASDHVSP